MTDTLRPCPGCGEIPERLGVSDACSLPSGWVRPDCSCDWGFEFDTRLKFGDELYQLAVKAWNEAPRIGDTKP